MIFYKEVLGKLKDAGYTTYTIRQQKLLSQNTMAALRSNAPISTTSIDEICRLLQCQPGDIIGYENRETEK